LTVVWLVLSLPQYVFRALAHKPSLWYLLRWRDARKKLVVEFRRGVSRLARASVPPTVSTGAWDGSRWVVDPTTTGSRAAREVSTAAQAPVPIDSRRAGFVPMRAQYSTEHSPDAAFACCTAAKWVQ